MKMVRFRVTPPTEILLFLEVEILQDAFKLVGDILKEVPNIVGCLVVQENGGARFAASRAVGARQPESEAVTALIIGTNSCIIQRTGRTT